MEVFFSTFSKWKERGDGTLAVIWVEVVDEGHPVGRHEERQLPVRRSISQRVLSGEWVGEYVGYFLWSEEVFLAVPSQGERASSLESA